jgi:hypothetical protein
MDGDGGAVVGVGHDGRTAANFGDDEDSWKTGSLVACDEAGVWKMWLVRGLNALGIGHDLAGRRVSIWVICAANVDDKAITCLIRKLLFLGIIISI